MGHVLFPPDSIGNCCADGDEEIRRRLTTKIFLRQAEVLTMEEWVKL